MATATVESSLDIACHANILVADASAQSLERALAAISDLGYRRVVLPPLDVEHTDAAALRAVFASYGVAPITIAGQGPDADVSSADDGIRNAGSRALRAVVDLTAALGGDQMNGVPYGLFGRPATSTGSAAFDRAAREVGAVADYAQEQGVTMTFEVLNRYETSVVNTAADAMRFVEASRSDHLWIHLDTFHMAVEESDMGAAIRTALPRLAFLELGQSGRGALSSGAVDLPGVIAQALDDGYERRWGVEAFSAAVLSPHASDMLAIWRDTFDDGALIAEDAQRILRQGWSASAVGRRAVRAGRAAES